jgi:hypothetical protein
MAGSRGTGFVNWDQFLNANAGAVQRTADALANPVAEAGQKANSALSTAQGAYNQAIGANTLTYNPANLGQAPNYYDFQYQGPASLADNKDFQSGMGYARTAQQGANTLADTYQRQGQLQKQFGAGSPAYDGNAARFDSALVGTGAGQRFEQLRKDYGGLLGTFSTARTNSEAAAKKAASDSATAAGQYRNGVAAALTGYRSIPGSGYMPPATPAQQQPAQQQQPTGTTLGTTPVQAPQAGGTNTLGTTQAQQPGQPKKKGGHYVGSTWVPDP